MAQLSDTDIFVAAKSNKPKALELAFERYWERLFRLAYKKLQSEALSKDVVQEVFIVMWENLDHLNEQQHLLPYLHVVLRHKVLNQFAKDGVRLKYAVDMASANPKSEPSVDQLLLNKELQQVIEDEISKMPPKMREIYRLKREQHQTIKQIAETLGISEQTVKNQLQNASGRLKTRLIDYDSSFLTLGLILSGLNMYLK